MNTFINEVDIICMECTNDIDNILNNSMISFMESGDVQESIIKKAIDKIVEMIRNIIGKIKSLFNKNDVDIVQKSINEAIKKDPSLKSKKVKVKSNEKLIALNKDTLKKVKNCKTTKEIDDAMEKYRKQRNALLGGVIISVPIIGIGAYMLSKQNKSIIDLNKNIDILKDNNDKLSKEFIKSQDTSKYYELKAHSLDKELIDSKSKIHGLESDLSTTNDRNKILERENKSLKDNKINLLKKMYLCHIKIWVWKLKIVYLQNGLIKFLNLLQRYLKIMQMTKLMRLIQSHL